jgi:hypothetical protein
MTSGLTACNGSGNVEASAGETSGANITSTSQTNPTLNSNPTENPPKISTAQIGETCHSDNPDKICLSLKYVVYEDSKQIPVISTQQALTNLDQINKLWSQCDIAFEIGEYLTPQPTTYGLNFNTMASSDLTTIRQKFQDSSKLVVVTTGIWEGSLGSGSANAWTTMPGGGAYGVVLEAPVADYSNIIAHELGHYLNLDHVSDTSDLMNPIIYDSSTDLTSSQCNVARAAAKNYWKAMYR